MASKSSSSVGLLLIIPLVIATAVLYPAGRQWLSDRPDPSEHALASNAESIQVWVSKQSGLYYCPGTKQYGGIKPGGYMSQVDAVQTGYRPISRIPCR